MKNIQAKQLNFEFFTIYILNKSIEAIGQIQNKFNDFQRL